LDLNAHRDAVLDCGRQLAEAIAARLPPGARSATGLLLVLPRPRPPDMSGAVRFEASGHVRQSMVQFVLLGMRTRSVDLVNKSWVNSLQVAGDSHTDGGAAPGARSEATRSITTPGGTWVVDDHRHTYYFVASDPNSARLWQQMRTVSGAAQPQPRPGRLERLGSEGRTVHFHYTAPAVSAAPQIDTVDIEFGAPSAAWNTFKGYFGEHVPTEWVLASLAEAASADGDTEVLAAIWQELRANDGCPAVIAARSSNTQNGQKELRIELHQGVPQAADFLIPDDYAPQEPRLRGPGPALAMYAHDY
jgi:hypothetical protein